MGNIAVILQILSEQQYLGDAGKYFSCLIHIMDKVNRVTQWTSALVFSVCQRI